MAGPSAIEIVKEAARNIAKAEERSGSPSDAHAVGSAWNIVLGIAVDPNLSSKEKMEAFKVLAGDSGSAGPVQGSGS